MGSRESRNFWSVQRRLDEFSSKHSNELEERSIYFNHDVDFSKYSKIIFHWSGWLIVSIASDTTASVNVALTVSDAKEKLGSVP